MPKYHGYPNASNNQRKVLKQHLEKLRKEGLLRAAPFEEALQTSTKVLTANQDTLPQKAIHVRLLFDIAPQEVSLGQQDFFQ